MIKYKFETAPSGALILHHDSEDLQKAIGDISKLRGVVEEHFSRYQVSLLKGELFSYDMIQNNIIAKIEAFNNESGTPAFEDKYVRVCKYCGGGFITEYVRQIYCDKDCRTAYYKENR